MIKSNCGVGFALVATLLSGCAASVEPLTTQEVAAGANSALSSVVANQEPISHPIDLYEAMARALKYNLDYKVESYQTALRAAELDVDRYDMLPNAIASAGYNARDNVNASNSRNVSTGALSLANSTSQDTRLDTSDLTVSWNIIDFGLSYVRSRQAADKVLIGRELQHKIAIRLLEDVRAAYWRTVTSERLLAGLRRLEGRAQKAMANAHNVTSSGEISLITALTYERELAEIERSAKELQRDLIVAKTQLAALMNLAPGTNYSVVVPQELPVPPSLKMSASAMIDNALNNRAEFRENLYQQRINRHEADAALLSVLPGIQLFVGDNYDGNSFLLSNTWVGWGAKASFSLLKAFRYPAAHAAVEAQQDLLREQSLALTMAIMTQVHVSRLRYNQFAGELSASSKFLDVQRRLVEQIRIEAQADRVSEQTLIREELNTLVAEAKYDIAFASVQGAYGSVLASMGTAPEAAAFNRSASLGQLASQLRSGRRLNVASWRTLASR